MRLRIDAQSTPTIAENARASHTENRVGGLGCSLFGASPQQQTGSSAKVPTPSFFRLLVAAAAAFAVYWLVQYLARRPARKQRHAATSFLDDIERALDCVGVQRRPNEPIEELTARLRASEDPVTPSLVPAVGAYLSARFGDHSLVASEKQMLVKSIEASASMERLNQKSWPAKGR